jgi:putative phosphoribosyl transferase
VTSVSPGTLGFGRSSRVEAAGVPEAQRSRESGEPVAYFVDRRKAGRQLGREVVARVQGDVVIVDLARGGVPVAFEVAVAMRAPLDTLVVMKLGAPLQPELAIGAIGEGGYRWLDAAMVARLGVSNEQVDEIEQREKLALAQRVSRYHVRAVRPELRGRAVVVVDDGFATGATARVACEIVRDRGASKVLLAIPVAPSEDIEDFGQADEVICLHRVRHFGAVGQYYDDFAQVRDEEVVALLEANNLD